MEDSLILGNEAPWQRCKTASFWEHFSGRDTASLVWKEKGEDETKEGSKIITF